MALELLIDSVDRIGILQAGTLSINQTNDGLNSTCSFDLLDHDVFQKDAWTVEETRVEDGDVITTYANWGNETKVEVKVCDGATTYFAGILSRIGPINRMGHEAQVVHCECHDFNQVLEESVVDELEVYGAAIDEDIIDDIFTKYVTGINFADEVAGGFVFDEIEFDGVTVREVLDILAAQSQYQWYVDYDKKLHYKVAGEDAPAWHLSDAPDEINSFSYFDGITKESDATNLVDSVFIIGEAVSLWFPAGGALVHPVIIRDTSIVDIDDMEARADAVLAKYGEPIATYTLKTYKDGLRAGMYVRLVCAFYDVDDTFLISSLTVTFPEDKDPVYEVVCGGLDSSASASARRLTQDAIQAAQVYVAPDSALSSLGWVHDLEFSATDADTVEWTAGTITAANGTTFNIVPGNTGNMGAGEVHHVYLDTAISVVALQTTQVAVNTVGANRIRMGMCWPSDVVGVGAGFHIYGGGDDVPLILCAKNIGADVITGDLVAANTLAGANLIVNTITGTEMGLVTLGANTWLRTAASPAARIELTQTELTGYSDAVTKQFYLDAATGKAYAGAGDVVLGADGIQIVLAGAKNAIEWLDGATTRAKINTTHAAGHVGMDVISGPPADADDPSTIILRADASAASADTTLYLRSEDTVQSGWFEIDVGGPSGYVDVDIDGVGVANLSSTRFLLHGDIEMDGGITLGGTGANPAADELCFGGAVVTKIYWATPNIKVDIAGAERLRINATGIEIAAGNSIVFGFGAAFWLTRVGENLVWHNSTGDHVVQVA